MHSFASSMLRRGIGLLLCTMPATAGSTPTTITVSSSANPSVLGQPITFTAMVSPSTVSGKVTFYDGTEVLGTRTFAAGQATLYTNMLKSGTHRLRAYYAGDGSYAASVSVSLIQAVSASPSTGFRTPVPYGIGSTSNVIVLGDFNGDGKADLAAGSSVLLGNGDGTFQVAYGISGVAAASGDFNGDGKTDLVMTGSGTVGIVLGNGDGTFQAAASYSVGVTPISVGIGDYNADGNVDLAVADYSDSNVRVLLGNGDGSFRPPTSYPLEFWSSSVAVGDFNGDGKADLAVAHVLGRQASFQANGDISVLLGRGDGTFGPEVAYPAGDVPINNKPQSLAVGDFNRDGNTDLAIADGNGFNLTVLLGKGDGTFRSGVNYAVNGDALSITVEDFNGDGIADLAVARGYNGSTGASAGLSVYLGNGDGTFQSAVNYDGEPATSLTAGEFNGDGKADLAVGSGGLSIFLGGVAPTPDLTLVKSHVGVFPQGQNAGTYVISVSNIGTGPTSGTVTVTDVLPTGLTAAAISGNGWTCLTSNGICTRSDPLGPGTSFPPITVVVNVAQGTPANVINVATVSGGGETNTTNNTATDSTQINITLLSQIITFAPLSDETIGNIPFSIGATATSGLTVSFTSNTTTICSVSGTIVTLIGTGTCSITATQNGNATFAVGAAITQTFLVKAITSGALRFVPVTPCRIADTRNSPNGAFAGPSIESDASRDFVIPASACGIPETAAAYSLNVTVVPHGGLGFLTIWPTGAAQPVVSTLNSLDGRIKANGAIVPAGANGSVSVFVTNTADVILDITGYFVSPSTQATALAFYPLTPCRVADTRNATGSLGSPFLGGGTSRTFPVLNATACKIPETAQAYSLNFTALPRGLSLSFLAAWPTGQPQPFVSTLNAVTGTYTANAALVPAGIGGQISVYATDDTDLVLDINGYFAPPAVGGLSLYNLTPCRVLDTRNPAGASPFTGQKDVNVAGSSCAVPLTAQGYVLNATVLPAGPLSFLSLWPQGQPQPMVSTLNAIDGALTSNLAISPTINGSISAFATNNTHLLLDISGYFAP